MSQFRQSRDSGHRHAGVLGKPKTSADRLDWTAAAITAAVYFAYILAIAFDPQSLGRPVEAGAVITWGMVAGLGVIVFSIAIALWYAGRANRFDLGSDGGPAP